MVEERNKIEDAKSNSGRGSKELDTETINIGLIRTFAIFLFTAKKNNWIKKDKDAPNSSENLLNDLLKRYAANFNNLKSEELDVTNEYLFSTIEADLKKFKKFFSTHPDKKEKASSKEASLKKAFQEIISNFYYSHNLNKKITAFIDKLKGENEKTELSLSSCDPKKVANFMLLDKTFFDAGKDGNKYIQDN